MKKTLFILLILSAVLTFFSCEKKDSQPVERKNLIGVVTVGNFTRFIKPGESITFYPKGVFHPENRALGCYTLLSGVSGSQDTTYFAEKEPHYISGDKAHSKVVRSFPDSVATFRVYIYIYPIDYNLYYNTYSYVDITTVDENTSLPATKYFSVTPEMEAKGWGSLEDVRDGEKYNYFTASGVKWMSQNLAYRFDKSKPDVTVGHDFDDSPAVRRMLGVLYSWEEAVKSCPDGWELPKDSDWAALAKWLNPEGNYETGKNFAGVAGKMMVDARFNGNKMWEHWPAVKIVDDDKVTFGAIPTGYMVLKQQGGPKCDFLGSMDYACYWTGDTYSADDRQAVYRYIYKEQNDLLVAMADKKTRSMPVRCVKH